MTAIKIHPLTKYLREARKKQGVSITGAAYRLGVHEADYRKIELNHNKLSDVILQTLCNILYLDYDKAKRLRDGW